MPVPFTTAALGGEIEVPTLRGSARLKIPAGTQYGTMFRLRGQGMPNVHGHGTGDLLVRVLVDEDAAAAWAGAFGGDAA